MYEMVPKQCGISQYNSLCCGQGIVDVDKHGIKVSKAEGKSQ